MLSPMLKSSSKCGHKHGVNMQGGSQQPWHLVPSNSSPAARLDVGVALFQEAAGAGDGAAGAHAGDQDVDLALRLVPDLGAGGLVVDARVARVLKLLQDERVGRGRRNLLRLLHRALHACAAALWLSTT